MTAEKRVEILKQYEKIFFDHALIADVLDPESLECIVFDIMTKVHGFTKEETNQAFDDAGF